MRALRGLAVSVPVLLLSLVNGCSVTDEEAASSEANASVACEGGGVCSDRPLDPKSPWPKFRRGLRQDGRSPVRPRPSDVAPWSFKTGKGIFSTAVIDGDENVYIGSADTFFYALDRRGELRWKVKNGEVIDSSALLDDKGRVYYGAGDGFVRALDRRDGRELWRFQAAAPESTGGYINWFEGNVAIGPDGTLYVPNDNRHVYGLDRDAGRNKPGWPWTMNDQTWSLPAIDPTTGNLYLGNNYIAGYAWMTHFWRNTFALSPTGQELWGDGVQATIAASPMLSEGRMVVGAYDGYVRSYDQASGRVVWSFATNDHVYASPGRLSDGTIIQPSSDGTVYALDAESGALRWQFDTREPIRSSPAIDGDDNIYFGGGDGRLYVLDRHGALRWSRRLIKEDRNDFGGSPALGRDFIVIAGESGEIFATPYDYCLRAGAASDPDCVAGGGEAMPRDGANLLFTTPLGSVLAEPPPQVEANQPLAFTLTKREGGDTKLALIDDRTLKVTLDPPAPVDVDTSGDRRFVTIVPRNRFAAGADGKVKIRLRGDYLMSPTREGLLFSGGRRAGSFDQTFELALGAGGPAAEIPVPARPGDAAGVFELHRIAVPYPTVMPSYNQIGFDSLHYLVGMVEGTSERRVGWVVGGMLDAAGGTVVDPTTQVLFPVEATYKDGLLNLVNESGFTVKAMNFDMPFDVFRVSAHLGADGTPLSQPGVHVKTKCANIPFYGPFLAKLGFCNPTTDVLNVFGSTNIRPHAGGTTTMPAGVGDVRFSVAGGWVGGLVTNPTVTATITGSSLRADEHSFGVLLVDAATGRPVSLKYGLASTTTRTSTPAGKIASVTVNLPESARPARMRAYLMVDTYPAASQSL
ncbi:MAG: PQQ-like beta-propeller repeat protein [Labilithrix sp.]|nr:PQQ-like beta-propeller repeat protein [Labilithrix sp.]MCW5812251.1 PQQ-like beta-propeller repeat protein [Labilithrix sp.]